MIGRPPKSRGEGRAGAARREAPASAGRIPAAVARAIRREGEKSYPGECCGALIGRLEAGAEAEEGGARALISIFPIENARDAEARRRRFTIEAGDFLRAERAAIGQGLELLGFYHSHPDHPARPSDYDRAQALPFYSYVIVAVEGGKAARMRSWRLEGDRASFKEEIIEITG
jgi:proteasome lid subunit RPN8/RPN11